MSQFSIRPSKVVFHLFIFEKGPVFPLYCSVLNKGTTGTIVFGLMQSLIGD